MIGFEDLIASMDEAGVDASVICGFSWRRSDLCRLHNDYLLEAASRHPKRLIAFLSLCFSEPEWSMAELKRGVREGGRGIGEVAFYDREMSPEDIHSMNPVLTELEQEGIPFLLHTNETIGHAYPGKGKTPLEMFHELAISHPNLPILLAHWGGGLLFYELMSEVAKALVNVYYDTAASPFLYSKKIYSIACSIAGAEKIIFGSDFPLLSPKRYFREIEEAGVKKGDQGKILGGNLSKLLGLDRP